MTAQEVLAVLISLTALSSYINYRFLKLPKSIGLTLITLTVALLMESSNRLGWHLESFIKDLLENIKFDETFLHGMLSFLLFAGALHVNTIELAKHKLVVLLLATFSVALSTFLVGFATFGLAQCLGITVSLGYCLVFGALISPTDPIAALGVLKNARVPKAVEMNIAGEALFNDGMGIVLFVILLEVANGPHKEWTPLNIMGFFLQQGLGGLLLGLTLGWFSSKILSSIDDYSVSIILTLALVTGGYALAESVMHVSGCICMAVCGLVIGATIKSWRMTKASINNLEACWFFLDEILNAILFVIIGIEFLQLIFTLNIIYAALGAIVIVLMARWISVALPFAFICKFKNFNTQTVFIMTWGGLRGGISIALALTIPEGEARDFTVAITYAVVLFSIMVQGLTLGSVVQRTKFRKNFMPDTLEPVTIESF